MATVLSQMASCAFVLSFLFGKKVPVKIKTRVFRDSPEAFFRAGFERIANTRMKGVPILNPKLHVSSVPFKKVNGQWVGGIVTPWSILVIRACGDPATWKVIPETKIGSVELPGGDFSFMGVLDPDLGGYQSCSLLSPTWEIGDQATGEAVARISLDTMLNPPKEDYKEPDPNEGSIPLTPAKAPDPEPQAPLIDTKTPMSRREIFTKTVEAAKDRAETASGKEKL